MREFNDQEKEVIEKFRGYLKMDGFDANVIDAAVDNWIRENPVIMMATFDSLISENMQALCSIFHAHPVLSGAFDWGNTVEGPDFWVEENEKWALRHQDNLQ